MLVRWTSHGLNGLWYTQRIPLRVRLSVLPSFVWFVLEMLVVLFFKCMAALFNHQFLRLVLCSRNISAAPGSPSGLGRLYKTVATMLIESCALLAVSSLLPIVSWAVASPSAFLFSPIFAEIQVRAFL